MTEVDEIDTATAGEMRAAMQFARLGNLAAARAAGERALAIGRDTAAAHALLGMLCCQMRDFPAGIAHLRAAQAERPLDTIITANLASALLETAALAEAVLVCSAEAAARDPSLRLWRLRGYLLQALDDHAAAAIAYAHVVAAAPDDFESWNNLGNAHAATGDSEASLTALAQAVRLRPDVAPVRLNQAIALMETGRTDEAIEALNGCAGDFPGDAKPLAELAGLYKTLQRDADALAAMERAVERDPNDADLQVKLGMERVIAWNMDGAETAFRAAISLKPHDSEAYVLLAVLCEHTNRASEFPALLAAAEAQPIQSGAIEFIRALGYRREGRFEEGLVAIAKVGSEVEPVRVAQLVGQFHDRLGDTEKAFAGFTEMNRQLALDPSEPLRRAEEYREGLRRDRAIVTREWYARWTPPAAPDTRRTPAFLVGFPRSGTTLLDTILMGHPQVRVLEERPPLTRVEHAIGGLERMADLSQDELAGFRNQYFREAAEFVDLQPDSLLVDKFPLHLNKVPIIHRLFPDARLILALRHPCDVVLSCFITNFRLNNAMVNFLDLETTATVYDTSFGFWEQAREIMSVRAHSIAYERLIEDSEAELRPLFDYLGLDWQEQVLDHRQTAATRGVISTASYAQVHEPLYKRAAGRWERYRDQLASVLPILRPWIKRFGYAD